MISKLIEKLRLFSSPLATLQYSVQDEIAKLEENQSKYDNLVKAKIFKQCGVMPSDKELEDYYTWAQTRK